MRLMHYTVFLRSWRELVDFSVSDAQIQRLLAKGILNIDLSQYVKTADQILAEACRKYNHQLDKIFAAPEGTFDKSEFQVQVGTPHILEEGELNRMPTDGYWQFDGDWHFGCEKRKGESRANIYFAGRKKKAKKGNAFPYGKQIYS